GRFANRIAKGRFTLNGHEYRLAINDGPNNLHGGAKGSRFIVFAAKQIDGASVQMSCVFNDGEEHFPGHLTTNFTYSLTYHNQPDQQLTYGSGYDHCYVLNKKSDELSFAARISDPVSGRIMEVYTTEPALQLYTGQFLEGKQPRDIGKGGARYTPHTGFCLEP